MKTAQLRRIVGIAALGIATSLTTAGVAQAGSSTTSSPTYSASAYALKAHVALETALADLAVDVGPVSPSSVSGSGGMDEEKNSLLRISNLAPAPVTIDAGVLNSFASGSGNEATAWANTADFNLNVADLVKASANVLQAQVRATCTGSSASANIANLQLTILGKTIPVDVKAPANTKIAIGPVTVIINEQGTTSSGETYANALHVIVNTPPSDLLQVHADVIVSHAQAKISGCSSTPPPCPVKDFVTGGGQITLTDGTSTWKASFGFVGGMKANGLQGHFNLVDKHTGRHDQSSTVTGYSGSGNTRTITYDTGTLVVTDNGEPGTSDTFQWTSGGYTAAGYPITHGNIQIHQPQGCGTSTKGGGRK